MSGVPVHKVHVVRAVAVAVAVAFLLFLAAVALVGHAAPTVRL